MWVFWTHQNLWTHFCWDQCSSQVLSLYSERRSWPTYDVRPNNQMTFWEAQPMRGIHSVDSRAGGAKGLIKSQKNTSSKGLKPECQLCGHLGVQHLWNPPILYLVLKLLLIGSNPHYIKCVLLMSVVGCSCLDSLLNHPGPLKIFFSKLPSKI